MYRTCSEFVVFMYRTGKSMNNLLSHCGLVDARIRASNKDLPVQDDEPKVIDDESSAETVVVIDSENEDTNGFGEDSETESNIVIVPTVYKNDAPKPKPGPKSKLKPKSREIWWCSPKKGTKTLFFLFSI